MATPILFLCSTPEELDAHQAIAYDVARELGFSPQRRDPAARPGRDAVAAVESQLAGADLVLALVGWRRGPVPPPLLGGDGLRPWLHFELRAAFRAGKKVVALLADDSFAPESEPERKESEARARAVVADLRGELAGIASPFGAGDLEAFAALLGRRLDAARQSSNPLRSLGGISAGLRRWPPPPLPEQPYPLLLPYHHPALLAGRDAQLAQLIALLEGPVAITGLHAPSGTGKSSLLAAGLVPRLREAGRAVAFDRHPAEPGLIGRLVDDLLDLGTGSRRDDPQLFRHHLALAATLAGAPPILVIDQIEDLLQPGARPQRARLGLALAASVQRQSSLEGPPQRWLLACRREFHGPLLRWLEDVLADARAEELPGVADLPHDLARGERFQDWGLDPLGAPSPGSPDPRGEAAAIFAEAIEKPLALRREDGSPRYPIRFVGDGARRLAAAFAASRLAEPRAPLAPELQVVLAHLLEAARRPAGAPTGDADRLEIVVPADPGKLLNQALEEHLRRALEAAFPGRGREARIGRTRALLALRELADEKGRRAQGLSSELLARAIGAGGREVLERLATSETRLVIPQEHQGGRYVLAHDRLAELLVRLTDDNAADLGFDHELIALRRVVTLEAALFEAGEPSPVPLPEEQRRAIEANAAALLLTPGQEAWWRYCLGQTARARARRRWRRLSAAAAVLLAFGLAIPPASSRSEQRTRLSQIDHGDPPVALAALLALESESATERAAGLAALARRPEPQDVVERGLGAWPPEERAARALAAVRLLLPAVDLENPRWVASLAWLLDFWASPAPAQAAEAAALREELLAPLRRRRPPPANFLGPRVALPGGSFEMGSGPGEGRDAPDLDNERPRHPVTLSPFAMLDHEITVGEMRRLFPEFGARDADESMPATGVEWYRAYTFAAWAGGRLPSEAEWEFAARADCPCRLDGWPERLDRVAFWIGNSLDPHGGELKLHPVRGKEPNAYGIYDLFGNAWEWTADWSSSGYPSGPQRDPAGPPSSPTRARTFRSTQPWPTYRAWAPADTRFRLMGFRVVWPDAGPPAGPRAEAPAKRSAGPL